MTSDLGPLSDLEVFARWIEVMEELKRRGLVRSLNSTPLGGYAEALVARQLGTEPLTGRDAGYDVIDPANESRVQVKARRYSTGSATTHFGEFDQLEQHRFDEFVGVLFNEDFTVRAAWRMPWVTVDRLAGTVRDKRRLYIRDVEKAVDDPTVAEFPIDQGVAGYA
jgi:hypothetical protein